MISAALFADCLKRILQKTCAVSNMGQFQMHVQAQRPRYMFHRIKVPIGDTAVIKVRGLMYVNEQAGMLFLRVLPIPKRE